jgi:hypothetical protein
MLGPDYFRFIFHVNLFGDRAVALEKVLEDTSRVASDTANVKLMPEFYKGFSSLITTKGITSKLPVLCINVTRMQDGNPAVVSNILIDSNFNNRIDILKLLQPGEDINLSTATLLGARFPYVSPAGRIDNIIPKEDTYKKEKDSLQANYFVDGGYFDNSGAGVVQEIIRAITNYSKSTTDKMLRQRAAKLRFVVLHITNSPVSASSLKPVAPLKNDMAAPLLTLVGAFDKQTTVNDTRLENLLKDMDSARGVYYPIHLYKDSAEISFYKDTINGPEKPYAMNWFISDTTLKRMDKRLKLQPKLNSLIDSLLKQGKVF